MEIQIQDITGYIEYLIKEKGLYVTLHYDIACHQDLIKYNFHLSPYCRYIKTTCEQWDNCIKRQYKVIQKCAEGEFFGVCYAGVGEFVYPVNYKGTIVGFISVSGYLSDNEEKTAEKLKIFSKRNAISMEKLQRYRYEYLNKEIPKKCELDIFIHPLVLMLEVFYEKYNSNKELSEDNTLYRNVLQYITLNHTRKITMQELSEKFFYSVSTLSHMFEKNCKMSLNKYIETLRMEDAKWLLKNSEYSMTEISEILGFCNCAYFSSVFKENFGVTPKKYRNTFKN